MLCSRETGRRIWFDRKLFARAASGARSTGRQLLTAENKSLPRRCCVCVLVSCIVRLKSMSSVVISCAVICIGTFNERALLIGQEQLG